MTAVTADQLQALYQAVRDFYTASGDLPFHGWHHIEFVYRKSLVFAEDLGADKNLTQVAALVHDLNHIEIKGDWSCAEKGQSLRYNLLHQQGISETIINQIEEIVISADMRTKNPVITVEAKALHDADVLFKILPVTPIFFASRFISQTNYNIRKLADKVVNEQKPLFDQDIYFYSTKAKALYLSWGKNNLALWEHVRESLNDPDIIHLLEQVGFDCS
jgi:uncharacterized protein